MIDKKKILITGGATFLAREISLALSKDYQLIIHYNKSEEDAKSLLKEIGEDNCKLIQADFNRVDPKLFFKKALSLYGSIDILINASSVFTKIDTKNLNKDILEQYYNLHSIFPLLLTIELYNHLKKCNKRGAVINISDAQINMPTKNRVPYYLSKESLSYQSKLLSGELAPTLRINEVAPGFTLAKSWETSYFDKVDKLLPFNITKVNQIIKAIKYFIESEQVSGQCLKVDSGLSTIPIKLI